MTATSDGDVEYFATFGPTTDLARYVERIVLLPSDPAALGEVCRDERGERFGEQWFHLLVGPLTSVRQLNG
jgi:hypothetical protein